MRKVHFLLMICILLVIMLSSADAATIPGYGGRSNNYNNNYSNQQYYPYGRSLYFVHWDFYGGQSLAVYAGPGYEYYRGAGGWASVSTNGAIYMAGRVGDWAMIMYQKSDGGFRVGFIDASELMYDLGGDEIYFNRRRAQVNVSCNLTDDPKRQSSTICILDPGDSVTFLASYYDHRDWAYVEVYAEEPVCGFVPMEYLQFL